MNRRLFIRRMGLMASIGMLSGCSSKASSSPENSEIVIRATNYSDELKQISVTGKASEGGDTFFEKQLALLGNATETQEVATVDPAKQDDELDSIVVSTTEDTTRTIEYDPDSEGNEDVDLRIYQNVIQYNYD